jgi:predicted permease
MRYRRLFRLDSSSADRDLQDEIDSHIEMRVEELVRRGEAPARARAIAMERFGSVRAVYDTAAERSMQLRRREFMGEIRADAKLVVRQARRAPLTTLLTVLTFAVAIGLTTTIFAIVDHVLLRPLPFARPERVVVLMGMDTTGRAIETISSDNWRDLSERNSTLQASALIMDHEFTVQSGGVARHVAGAAVSSAFFDVLGAPFIKGRPFVADDAKPGASSIIVSNAFLAQYMGGDMSGPVTLDEHEYQVVGVIPDRAVYPAGTQVWRAIEFAYYGDGARNNVNFEGIGRLRDGVTIERASQDLSNIARGIERSVPTSLYTHGVSLMPLQTHITGDVSLYLRTLLGAVLCVLLIACANLAGINFSRATTRAPEISVRMALGAGRARVMRQLFPDQLLLAAVGGALGVVIAWQATSWAAAYAASMLPRAPEIAMDGRVLLFATVITALAGVVAAIAPTWRAAGAAPRELMGVRGVARGGRGLAGRLIVAGEIAVAVLLLSGGALLIRSFQSMISRDLGFDPAGVVTAEVSLTSMRYMPPASVEAFWANAMPRLQAIPGATAVARARGIPTAFAPRSFIEVEGSTDANPGAVYHAVSPDYFKALGLRLAEGRAFGAIPDIPRAVVVNRLMADRFWPGQSPIGKRLRAASMEGIGQSPAPWLTVIGVVENARQWGYENDAEEEMFVNDADVPRYQRITHIVARGAPGGTAALAGALRRELHAIDPSLPVEVLPMSERLANMTTQRRIIMTLITIFATVALSLAGIGIYALLSFAVTQQTREIGVRSALGATQSRIIRHIVTNAVMVAGAGALAGIVAAYWLGKLITSLLIDVTRGDVISYAAAAFVLLLVACCAAAVPAWRAARIDPLTALRAE